MSAPTPPTRTGGPARPDQSMLLLRNLVEDSLDEGYARAAARRAAGEPARKSAVLVLTVGLLLVGLLLATAFAQTRQRASSAAAARDALVAEVEQRSAANDKAQARLDQQRAAVQRPQRQVLALYGAGTELADRPPGGAWWCGWTTPPATATAPTRTRAPMSTTPAGSPTGTCRRWSTRSG